MQMIKQIINHPEESHRASAIERSVRDIRLAGEVLGIFYWRDHPLHCEESRQIRSVRRDNDQGEEPPYAAHDTRARCLRSRFASDWIDSTSLMVRKLEI